ncbi:polysaccharide biosynthesis protein, partial [Pelagibacterales bacterium SAG-MED46]|nr:polysaccharide biosynthesis protein [Pelagibacterales bacterium SAG-MED46]
MTGAAGTIGSEICRQLIFQDAKKIIGVDNSELSIYEKKNRLDKNIKLLLCDVNNQLLLNKIINDNKIDLIIHAAAYKHVNILEENIISAVCNNILATKNLCEIAKINNTDL